MVTSISLGGKHHMSPSGTICVGTLIFFFLVVWVLIAITLLQSTAHKGVSVLRRCQNKKRGS